MRKFIGDEGWQAFVIRNSLRLGCFIAGYLPTYVVASLLLNKFLIVFVAAIVGGFCGELGQSLFGAARDRYLSHRR